MLYGTKWHAVLLSGRSEVRVLSGVPKQENSRKLECFWLFFEYWNEWAYTGRESAGIWNSETGFDCRYAVLYWFQRKNNSNRKNPP